MAEPTLTKKQQKAAEWKEGKGKKAKTEPALEEAKSVPIASGDTEDTEADEKVKPSASSSKKVEANTTAADPEKPEKRNKKRKRLAEEAAAAAATNSDINPKDAEDESPKAKQGKSTNKKPKSEPKSNESAAPAKKTTFGDDGQVASETAVDIPAPAASDSAAYKDAKFILFVGNMSFDTSKDTISKHFGQSCGETPSVRLLTSKVNPSALAKLPASKRKSIAKGKAKDPSAAQSKGCAFVEFKSSNALKKALQFHHTMLDGRKINVELTAGGGGKTDARMEKIKKKNAELEKERAKLHGKYVAPKTEARKAASASKEGAEQTRPNKRVKIDKPAEAEEQGAAQWGKTKDGKSKERKLPRFMATGSNAVRVAPTS